MGTFPLRLSEDTPDDSIEPALIPHIKHIDTMLCDQLPDHTAQLWSYILLTVPMAK